MLEAIIERWIFPLKFIMVLKMIQRYWRQSSLNMVRPSTMVYSIIIVDNNCAVMQCWKLRRLQGHATLYSPNAAGNNMLSLVDVWPNFEIFHVIYSMFGHHMYPSTNGKWLHLLLWLLTNHVCFKTYGKS